MNESWKDYFHFTKNERNGLLVLLLLGLLLLTIPPWLRHQFPQTPPDTSAFEQQVQALLAPPPHTDQNKTTTTPPTPSKVQLIPFDPNQVSEEILQQAGLPPRIIRNLLRYREKGGQFRKAADFQKLYGLSEAKFQELEPYLRFPTPRKSKASSTSASTHHQKASTTSTPILQNFDPNQASKAELLALGLPARVCQTILNFRNKGGTFRRKTDLQKIYGLSPASYDQLRPYIQIQTDTSRAKPLPSPPAPPILVDVNQANLETWQSLPGIGPYYAQKIIDWREKLGGFSHLDQIKATYRLPDSTFQKIRAQLQISPILHLIPVNKSSFQDLRQHPYINYKQAQILTRYRENHGNIKNWEDFSQIQGFTVEQRKKLQPYLSFK